MRHLEPAASLAIVLGLAVVHRYSFQRLLYADVLLVGRCAAAARGRLRFGPAAKRITWTALIPASLVLLALWRFFPPSEYIIGGKDPGTYVNEGIQIAQRGAIVVRDPVVAAVPAVCPRPFLSVVRPPRLRTRCASWASSSRTRHRRRRRPVSSPVSGVDCHRVWHRWIDRRAADSRRVGDPRPACGVFRGARVWRTGRRRRQPRRCSPST